VTGRAPDLLWHSWAPGVRPLRVGQWKPRPPIHIRPGMEGGPERLTGCLRTSEYQSHQATTPPSTRGQSSGQSAINTASCHGVQPAVYASPDRGRTLWPARPMEWHRPTPSRSTGRSSSRCPRVGDSSLTASALIRRSLAAEPPCRLLDREAAPLVVVPEEVGEHHHDRTLGGRYARSLNVRSQRARGTLPLFG
jgi:hypothetical protein